MHKFILFILVSALATSAFAANNRYYRPTAPIKNNSSASERKVVEEEKFDIGAAAKRLKAESEAKAKGK